MSIVDLGNHALCGQIARMLETFKIDGTLNSRERARLLALLEQLQGRAFLATDGEAKAPG